MVRHPGITVLGQQLQSRIAADVLFHYHAQWVVIRKYNGLPVVLGLVITSTIFSYTDVADRRIHFGLGLVLFLGHS